MKYIIVLVIFIFCCCQKEIKYDNTEIDYQGLFDYIENNPVSCMDTCFYFKGDRYIAWSDDYSIYITQL